MNGLAASRPSATVSSVGATAPLASSASSLSVSGVDSASTIMMATSPSVEHPARDDHVEGGVRQLLMRRERHPLAVDQRDPHPADGAGERQARQLGGHGRGVDRHHVVQVLRIEREYGRDDLDLVAQALDEGRAQRPVDEPAGQDRVLGRTALPAEERAGDPAHRVHPLFDVHREREEVQVVLRLLGRRGRGRTTVSPSRVTRAEPAAWRASRPVSNLIVCTPNSPLSITASALRAPFTGETSLR